MKRTSASAVLVATLAAVAGLPLVLAHTPVKSAARVEIQPQLREIREVRSITLIEDHQGFFFSSDQPGLFLTFDLPLPRGVRLLAIEQPDRVNATDSTGSDLSQIEPGFMDELEWVEMAHDFGFDDDSAQQATFKLTLPAREARHFSLDAQCKAITYRGTAVQELPATTEWRQIDPRHMSGEEVRFRLQVGPDASAGIEVSPASGARFIESVEVNVEGDVLESHGSMSDGRSIVYFFDDEIDPEEPVTLRLTLRTGVETDTIVFKIVEQKLP